MAASEPALFGSLGADDALDPERRVGVGVALGTVDAVVRVGRGPGKVHHDLAVPHRQRRHELDRTIEPVDGHAIADRALGQPVDGLAHGAARAVDDEGAELVEILDAGLVHHLDDAAAADLVARGQRVEIALHLDGLADVGAHELEQPLVDDAGRRERHDGDEQALVIDLSAIRRHAEPADIDHVAGAGKQRDELALAMGGRHHGEVVQMARALPGVVRQIAVALAAWWPRESARGSGRPRAPWS